jgi:hypothetical protein
MTPPPPDFEPVTLRQLRGHDAGVDARRCQLGIYYNAAGQEVSEREAQRAGFNVAYWRGQKRAQAIQAAAKQHADKIRAQSAEHLKSEEQLRQERTDALRIAAEKATAKDIREHAKRSQRAADLMITRDLRPPTEGLTTINSPTLWLALFPGQFGVCAFSKNVPGARPGTDHCAARSSAAGTTPQEGADRHRAVALAAPQREEFGVDDVVAAGPSAGTEPGREANPCRGLGRGRRQQGSGNDKRSESPSHLVLLR